MNRRELISRILAGSALMLAAPAVINSCSKKSTADTAGGDGGTGNNIEIDLTKASNSTLNNTGGWIVVQDVIVINLGGGNYAALSSICTHQGCTVGYNNGTGNIQCPCHGSVYTTAGTVVSGPAPRALPSYSTTLSGNILTVRLS